MSKLEVHVGGTFADTKRRVLEAVAAAERGPVESQTHITFESWAALANVMTPKRFEILRHIHRQPVASIAALARDLGRDYKRVHEDVEALVTAGLLEREQGEVRASYDEIRAVIAL
jgi:predicted transcriptional regulator